MSVFCKCLQIKDLSQMPAWRGRQAFNVTTYYSVYCVTRLPILHARSALHSDFTSMKTGKNMDSKLENRFPSMKTALFVDGSQKIQLPSMKTAKNVDFSPTL